MLSLLAAVTGGRYYSITSQEDLQKALAEILDDVRHQYVLGFSTGDGAVKFRPLTVEVKGRAESAGPLFSGVATREPRPREPARAAEPQPGAPAPRRRDGPRAKGRITMNRKPWIVALSLAAALVGTTGCATKKYVKQETGAVNTRVDEVQGQVEQSADPPQHPRAGQSRSARSRRPPRTRWSRAQEAGKLAEGKFLYETVLTDEKVKFGFDTSDLSPEAQAALDEFAAKIKQENKNVYVEIQGHTDNVGSDKYNEELGLLRAESVRRYLNQKHELPAPPHQRHLLRRDAPARGQQDPRGAFPEPPRRAGGAGLRVCCNREVGAPPCGRPARL